MSLCGDAALTSVHCSFTECGIFWITAFLRTEMTLNMSCFPWGGRRGSYCPVDEQLPRLCSWAYGSTSRASSRKTNPAERQSFRAEELGFCGGSKRPNFMT